MSDNPTPETMGMDEIQQALTPSPELRQELLIHLATVQLHIKKQNKPSPGIDAPLPEAFEAAWSRFAESVLSGSLDQHQRFVEAAAACPLRLVVVLIRASVELNLIPAGLAQQVVTEISLRLNQQPKPGVMHG